MMRFRRLTSEEFASLEQEFIKYLAQQGIPGEEWARRLVVREDVEEHLDGFSEYFFDRATAAIEFLERVDGEEVWHFQFSERSAALIRVRAGADGAAEVLGTGQKTYEPEARGREIFLLLEQGAKPADGSAFEALQSSLNPR